MLILFYMCSLPIAPGGSIEGYLGRPQPVAVQGNFIVMTAVTYNSCLIRPGPLVLNVNEVAEVKVD